MGLFQVARRHEAPHGTCARQGTGIADPDHPRRVPRSRSYRTDRREEEVVVLVIITWRGLPPESSSPGSVRTTLLTERLI